MQGCGHSRWWWGSCVVCCAVLCCVVWACGGCGVWVWASDEMRRGGVCQLTLLPMILHVRVVSQRKQKPWRIARVAIKSGLPGARRSCCTNKPRRSPRKRARPLSWPLPRRMKTCPAVWGPVPAPSACFRLCGSGGVVIAHLTLMLCMLCDCAVLCCAVLCCAVLCCSMLCVFVYVPSPRQFCLSPPCCDLVGVQICIGTFVLHCFEAGEPGA